MAETKRVLILAVRFGSGHWQAALALKKALLREYPALEVDVVNYLVFAGFLFDKVTRLTYHDLMIRVPPIYRRFFAYTDQLQPQSLFQRFIRACGVPAFLRYYRRKSPQLIISTFPVPSAAVAMLKQRGLVNCPLVTVVTDYILHQQWIQPGTDLYLVASPVVADELVRRGVPRERVEATGIPIDLRFERRTPQQLRRLLPDLSESQRSLPLVLVVSGATSFGGELGKICHVLANQPVPLVAVVLGVRFPRLRLNLRAAVSKGRNKVFIIGYSRHMPRFMRTAACLISKAGGITASEALASELPMIIYKPLPCQEERNRDFLVREGAALSASSLAELEQSLRAVLQDDSLRARMREAAIRLRHPDSSRVAVQILGPYLDRQAVQ